MLNETNAKISKSPPSLNAAVWDFVHSQKGRKKRMAAVKKAAGAEVALYA